MMQLAGVICQQRVCRTSIVLQLQPLHTLVLRDDGDDDDAGGDDDGGDDDDIMIT